MGLISRNLGDENRAFLEFQSALEAARTIQDRDAESYNDELVYLCEAADRLGLSEEGGSMYKRLIRIADGLIGDKRRDLLMQIASSCRRSGMFDREYAIIEDLIEDQALDDSVLSRLDTLNRAMRSDGTFDYTLLNNLEKGAEADYTLIRGILAFGAFQFNDALKWFKRSVEVNNRPDTRLWFARAAWYADIPLSDINAEKDDLLETRIIHILQNRQSIKD